MTAADLIAELPVEPDEYACRIVLGADEHREEIDALIRKFSEHWSLERMPVIDRALLRLGTYELAWVPETPTGAIITEAVELAKQYSTKDSGRFVNGLLARIAEDVRGGRLTVDAVRRDELARHPGDHDSRHGRGAARRRRRPARRSVGRARLERSRSTRSRT